MKNLIFMLIVGYFVGMSKITAQTLYNLERPMLYKNCQNKIFVATNSKEETELMTNEKNVEIQKTAENNVFLVEVQNQSQVVLSTGNVNHNISVSPVPPPNISVAYQDEDKYGELSLKNPLILEKDKNFIIKCKPEERFARMLPKESNFEVTQFTVRQFREGRCIFNKVIESNILNVSIFKTIKESDGIQIEVQQVIRTNYKGVKENCPIINPIHSFFVTL